MALHALRGTPLTGEELRAIVARHQQHGWAGTSGTEPLASIAKDLDLLGVRYTLFPYREPWPEAEWHPLLLANAGRKPIVLQVANAEALPGDERGVRYHFICVEEVDSRGYPTGDGDNAAAPGGRLVTYDIGQLAAAQPCGMIVCEPVSAGTSASSASSTKDAAGATGAAGAIDLTGVGEGVRQWIEEEVSARKLPATWRVLLAAEPDAAGPAGSTITVLGDEGTDVVVYWDGERHVVSTSWGGHALLHVLARARTAEANLAEQARQLAEAREQTSMLEQRLAAAEARTSPPGQPPVKAQPAER